MTAEPLLDLASRPVPTTVEEFAACDESDLEIMVPWTGPGIDPETGALRAPLPDTYVVATSGGWPKPNAMEVATELNRVLLEELWGREGLIAATFAISQKCWMSSRALAVWEDEDALTGFLQSEGHMNAVRKTKNLAYAWEGTRWVSHSPTLPTFDEVRARLAQQRRNK
ncbi:hypothetical protein E2C00_33550 [Streptomyces sp. WAC05374]|uniref:hypothetical protein n=1 Tax=Streptomyces sp. WAC05374 TaxID=2487420 RepID=UPI000F88B8A6|nr:hypothetical protein [Streptomyces sp. WAC05374]RST18376.1 hypothetical protein EF905_05595 [Streptomyces sp. WAC05374]TDF36208.1 hypothetical protein E2B92_31255 [Streptomyces sp. WAC05374]TDF45726.1 hypothetical protein E2C02_32955 [Streptomyces sp. WAC05374]TDF46645.1 hypothetical protein E2C00_33550 [Streptomyces sp. WAC05374]